MSLLADFEREKVNANILRAEADGRKAENEQLRACLRDLTDAVNARLSWSEAQKDAEPDRYGRDVLRLLAAMKASETLLATASDPLGMKRVLAFAERRGE